MKYRQIIKQTDQFQFDLNEEWPFTNAIENGDPLLSELFELDTDDEVESSEDLFKIKAKPSSTHLPIVSPYRFSIF